MRQNPHRKTRSQIAPWSVEPVRLPEPTELAAALLAMTGAGRRYFDQLHTELRNLRNAPRRVIR